jgi:hypothetical protein
MSSLSVEQRREHHGLIGIDVLSFPEEYASAQADLR